LAGVPVSRCLSWPLVFLVAWLMIEEDIAVGMFVESVGHQRPNRAYYSGINEKNIKLLVYTFCGLCAAHRRL
jgi:ribose/xylose/arabinose/galactoside ABC-type transport system permease subunit